MPTSAAKRLSAALCAITGNGDPERLVAFARMSGIGGVYARRAAKGIPINVDSYLKLCGAIGIDPVTGKARQPLRHNDLDWKRLGRELRQRRTAREQSVREAAKHIGISISTISRIENDGNRASPLSRSQNIESALAVCGYLGTHPYDYAKMSNVKHARKHVDKKEELTIA